MVDKAKFGERHVCHACGCKFYDMHRNPPLCPRCGADVSQKPIPEEPALDVLPDDEPPDADLESEEILESDEIAADDEELEEPII